MKRVIAFIGALLFLGFPLFSMAASPLPSPSNYINDYAGVLTDDQENQLNGTLKSYEDATTNQIFVAIVNDLGGQDIESYAGDVFKSWKIGQKGKDNGILILASINDDIRRIEIGYGLEGDITDGQAGTIIRETLKPAFQQKKYFEGLTATIDQIKKEISGEIITQDSTEPSNSNGWNANWVIFLLFFGFQILAGVGRWLAKSKSWWHGGLLGLGLGVIVGIVIKALIGAAIAATIFALFGLLIDFFLSKNYKPGSLHRRSGLGGPWFWGGGGGGGFGGGGFGGGGGGGSGGGGASG